MPDFLTSHAPNIVRGLAFASLFGLLFGLGLETPFHALWSALKKVRLSGLILTNFLLVPVLACAIILQGDLGQDPARALILLACAPFAPVVPLFARMARARLALATALTAVFPAFSALLTPCAVGLSFWLIHDQSSEIPSSLMILELLAVSITLPLALGIALREICPTCAHCIQKPTEWLSEAIGVISLGFLASLESHHLTTLTAHELWPFLLFYEATFVIGLAIGKAPIQQRLVLAFGTANRNIGLAILLAATLSDQTALLGEVLGQSLLMLALGLIHVGVARLCLGAGRFRD